MAKKFLDILADANAYDEDVLDGLIPSKRKKAEKNSRGGARRKKRFIDSINESLPPEPDGKGRKSLLETMEEALDNHVFDEMFPRKSGQGAKTEQDDRQLEIRFSTMITSNVLNRARQIAEQKGVRVKDVINAALRMYVEQESDK